MAGVLRFRFLAIAMVFHLVYIFSIFDIYFVSPVVSGMRLFQPERPAAAKAPADRLVLFVGDGLRADKALQSHPEPYPETKEDLIPRPLAPFLRSRILEHGTFGVSHTRVPTESRPGHVALIAGLYEDVSAVTTGWKLNPVHFDSVFNRSRHTWSWGSPDILPMFELGAIPGRVDAFSYAAEDEDFSQDATHLDYWVFDHVKELFAEARTNETLAASLHQDKIVFFLHLLGLDTTGHAYRPYSKEYLNNIKVVDKGVEEITELIESFYGDDRTAFVFTADHGMSDWGSHGDGHPNNTRTPLIAWGSGVAEPQLYPAYVATKGMFETKAGVKSKSGTGMAPGHDEYSSDWNLDHVRRIDVEQADVAALMAYLAGLEFPANSVGELPLDYVAASLEEKARAALLNVRGVLEMYRVKEEKKSASQLRFRPFQPLSDSVGDTEGLSAEHRMADIDGLISTGHYEEAVEEAAALFKIALSGLRYLQTYDWLFLRALITVGYLGWIAYALTTVVDLHVLDEKTRPQASRNLAGAIIFSAVLFAMYASFAASKSPLSYYAYAFFPVFFWEEVYARRDSLVAGRKQLFGHFNSGAHFVSLLINVTLYIAVIVFLALGYIHRDIFTALFVIGAFWPAVYGLPFLRQHFAMAGLWSSSCLAMSTFTLLPAMKVENIELILLGGSLMVAVGILYLVFEDVILADFAAATEARSASSVAAKSPVVRVLLGAQVGLIILSMWVTRSSALSLQAKAGLPRGNQVVGWLILVMSLVVMPMAHSAEPNRNYLHRLMVIFLTFAPTFVILTISYEGLFYLAFSAVLVAWARMEHAVHIFSTRPLLATPKANGSGKPVAASITTTDRTTAPYRPLTLADTRVALFFFVLLQAAFFSTGNVASISSFSLDSVYRLIPVFDPFSQGALLVVKLLVPFALISANLGILNKQLGVAPSALFMTVMAISDILTLYFFWVVKDEGSWLEIGSTITHFAVASLLCVFVAGLEGVSALFIAGVEVNDTILKPANTVVKSASARPSTNGQSHTPKVSGNK
ncbi:GPI-anchor biosynthetic protein [Grosmannia clavigera kw1407]|uniref:GPI ethanolamine phosphate transferase 1 n=1 Tax=Grosmannia clavigera (strain kw1407 / UAMH 11150) TaxID=655863 RepID=F0XFC2_GROCL|nr:GPI-anchor biosynthetic protein [Grosmannia clavigera kw1407]EFX04785.1 GPI-anchor biosynthetic protein [Grosmannia clavigera kw1407]